MALPADARPIGTVVSVRGSVIEVRFSDGGLPAINEALEVGGSVALVAEVQAHLDERTVRAVKETVSSLSRFFSGKV